MINYAGFFAVETVSFSENLDLNFTFYIIIDIIKQTRTRMKKSVVRDIYYGEHVNYETIALSDKYNKISIKRNELFEKLEKELSEAQRKLLDELDDLNLDLESEAAQINYIEGFKLGLKLGIELL